MGADITAATEMSYDSVNAAHGVNVVSGAGVMIVIVGCVHFQITAPFGQDADNGPFMCHSERTLNTVSVANDKACPSSSVKRSY